MHVPTCICPCPACCPAGWWEFEAGRSCCAGRGSAGTAGSLWSSPCCQCCRPPGRRRPTTDSARCSLGQPLLTGAHRQKKGEFFNQFIKTDSTLWPFKLILNDQCIRYLVKRVHHSDCYRLIVHNILAWKDVLCWHRGAIIHLHCCVFTNFAILLKNPTDGQTLHSFFKRWLGISDTGPSWAVLCLSVETVWN